MSYFCTIIICPAVWVILGSELVSKSNSKWILKCYWKNPFNVIVHGYKISFAFSN